MSHDEEIKISVEIPTEDIDDNTQDLTVYDLAEKLAAGRILTVGANHEVGDELDRLRQALIPIYNGQGFVNGTPRGDAKELLWLRAELEKLVGVRPDQALCFVGGKLVELTPENYAKRDPK